MTISTTPQASELFAEFADRLRSDDAKAAFQALVDHARSDPRYLFEPRHTEGKRSVEYHLGETWAYAFIVNRNDLLFYYRRPSGRVDLTVLQSLTARGLAAQHNDSGEIRIRIKGPLDAAGVLSDIFNSSGSVPLQTDSRPSGSGGASSIRDCEPEEPKLDAIPEGTLQPEAVLESRQVFSRDDAVKRWVLVNAAGICECCKLPAPFEDSEGRPFLEVHHLKQLADGGSDRPSNTIAVCPNCHRHLHHGHEADALLTALYNTVSRLQRE